MAHAFVAVGLDRVLRSLGRAEPGLVQRADGVEEFNFRAFIQRPCELDEPLRGGREVHGDQDSCVAPARRGLGHQHGAAAQAGKPFRSLALQQGAESLVAPMADHEQVGAAGLFGHVLWPVRGQCDGTYRDAEPIGQVFGKVREPAGAVGCGRLASLGQHHELQDRAMFHRELARALDGVVGLRREGGNGQDGSNVHGISS